MNVGKYTKSTVVSCNVSYEEQISPAQLKAILSGEDKSWDKWLFHISTLFNEVPYDYLSGMMDELELSLEDVQEVYDALPEVLQGKHFREFSYHG